MAKRETQSLPTAGAETVGDEPQVRPAAKALVRAGDSVLLVREHHADGSPFWTLPGGGVHPGEAPTTALERELGEELRCRCLVGDLTATFPYAHSDLRDTVSTYAVYHCWLLSRPEPVRSEGITGVDWGRPGALPEPMLPQVRTIVAKTPGAHGD